MKEERFFYDPQVNGELPQEEARHAVKVLRLTAGDELLLMDGKGSFFRAEITVADNHRCLYRILETMPQEPAWEGHIHLAIAPTKLIERMEWMIEKAVEIGVDEVSFLDCKFSERRVVKLPRLEKIAVSAMKQSRKAWATQLHDMQSFKEFIHQERQGVKYIAHCYDEIPRIGLFAALQQQAPEETVTVMIGPEGDFSIDEVREAISCGWQSVHLGTSRLRTETAGLSAVMMTQLSK